PPAQRQHLLFALCAPRPIVPLQRPLSSPPAYWNGSSEGGGTVSDDRPVPEPDTDLEYDLAHEASTVSDNHDDRRDAPVVSTSTPDYDGDYSYDLAHVIPMPERPDH